MINNNASAFSAGLNLINHSSQGFDYGSNFNMAQAEQFGQQRGNAIGTMAGLALSPVLGPLSVPIGSFLGETISKRTFGSRAENILNMREQKRGNFASMYEDIVRQRDIDASKREGRLFIDNRMRNRLPSL